jgi:hypothetical protein
MGIYILGILPSSLFSITNSDMIAKQADKRTKIFLCFCKIVLEVGEMKTRGKCK